MERDPEHHALDHLALKARREIQSKASAFDVRNFGALDGTARAELKLCDGLRRDADRDLRAHGDARRPRSDAVDRRGGRVSLQRVSRQVKVVGWLAKYGWMG